MIIFICTIHLRGYNSSNNYFVNTGATAKTTGFINGAGQIWLDNVRCVGTETRLIDCPRSPLGQHNCMHTEDAGVNCPSKNISTLEEKPCSQLALPMP